MPRSYEFETLAVKRDAEDPRVLEVALNRPEQLNALNQAFWHDMRRCFEAASEDPEVHCVVLHGGTCRLFCSGLDLNSELLAPAAIGGGSEQVPLDASRRALRMEKGILAAQEGISCVERCRKPVVAALHNAVVGGGVDLACACDVRYCSEDAFFCIAEVNVGLAADLGTLQRLPKIVGNDSVVRELALTGRRMGAAEARALGLVSTVLPDRESCLAEARKVARTISAKSPVAVIGTKVSLNYSRDHTVKEGLDHIRLWNGLHLQSDDVPASVQGLLTKKPPAYAKL